jgi:hypothetical protein
MPRNKLIQCETCGKNFGQGYAHMNHTRGCHLVRDIYVDADVVPVEDDGELELVVHDDEERAGNEDQPTVEDHMSTLDRRGTLDTTFMLQYLGWGRLTLNDQEREACLFLRSIEMGGGASTASSRATLDYVHSLGGRGDILPKTVRTCWKLVEDVSVS